MSTPDPTARRHDLAEFLFAQIRDKRGDQGILAAANLIAQSALASRDDVAAALLVTEDGYTYPNWALFAVDSKRLPLSSGERRLVQLACSLAGTAEVNLWDILSSLDAGNTMHALESIGFAATGRWMTSAPQMRATLTPAAPEQPSDLDARMAARRGELQAAVDAAGMHEVVDVHLEDDGDEGWTLVLIDSDQLVSLAYWTRDNTWYVTAEGQTWASLELTASSAAAVVVDVFADRLLAATIAAEQQVGAQ